jgi:DNA-binding helix-hairpin-helix protein with protein kinase domain
MTLATSVPAVACKRCAVVAAHPYGSHPRFCPNCMRDRRSLGVFNTT